MKKGLNLLFVTIFLMGVALTACAPNDLAIKEVACPPGFKVTENCVALQDLPDVLKDGQMENIGLSSVDYPYATVSSPEGTYLYQSPAPNVVITGNGTNFITISLAKGANVAEVRIRLSSDTNDLSGSTITTTHYKPFN